MEILLREGGAYVITGGLGHAGLRLAEELSRALHARLALVAGSAFPERGEWEGWLATRGPADLFSRKIRHLLEIEKAGGKVVVLRANLTGEQQLAAVLDRAAARLGRLDGVLHLAGPPQEEPAALLPAATGRALWEEHTPQGIGLPALERALAGRDLDFCLLLSSNAGLDRGQQGGPPPRCPFPAASPASLFRQPSSLRGGPANLESEDAHPFFRAVLADREDSRGRPFFLSPVDRELP